MAIILMMSFTACSSKDSSQGGSDNTAKAAASAGSDSQAAAAQDVTLKIWVPEEAVTDTDNMVKEFDKIHDEFNITYEIAVVGIDEAPAQVETDADVAADIFYVPSGGVADMVNKGLLLPLVKDYDTIESDLPESALTAVTINGLHYAVPFSPNTYFMYYNKELFTEADVKNLDAMMAKDLGAGKWNFSTQLTNSWYAESFFFANGCTLFGADGRDASSCTFNNSLGLSAGNYMIDLAANPKYLEDVDGVGGSAFKEASVPSLPVPGVLPSLRKLLGTSSVRLHFPLSISTVRPSSFRTSLISRPSQLNQIPSILYAHSSLPFILPMRTQPSPVSTTRVTCRSLSHLPKATLSRMTM